ncbi:MAG: alpha/beta fold hydrolase [Bryobacterales bacterium]|nr:alpha/beta fold hydrolase [Bryobacterales bacterium]
MSLFAAGLRSSEVPDPPTADSIPLLILYPSEAAEQNETLGPYTISAARNAPVAAGTFPLVVLSHGTGGSPLVYRTLAAHLARNGFVVLLPEHPRNNRNNNELAGTAAILANRPRHLRLVADWAFLDDALAAALQPGAFSIIGHSLGGYTALAAAGGAPTAFPHESPDHVSRPIEVTPDPRVNALVLLAPASPWFMAPGALSAVRVPILMLTAEKDPHTPREHGEIIRRGLPAETPLEHRVVPNAGHFSFLSPFPQAMIAPSFPPSQDPAGFDREQFHHHLNAEVLSFLDRVSKHARPHGAST